MELITEQFAAGKLENFFKQLFKCSLISQLCFHKFTTSQLSSIVGQIDGCFSFPVFFSHLSFHCAILWWPNGNKYENS